ncbi:hypothetical protein J5N97_029914 [Dioscorea zingiberensis]|uniref:Uncharacterized protein n=1 Tax=Dioscorea zingiberensis TaxID=325984 RepID=A0A9D5H3R5_9LILI|nr:hypothetical protein J5N97_029914 [Dioscorea zingiberensis]
MPLKIPRRKLFPSSRSFLVEPPENLCSARPRRPFLSSEITSDPGDGECRRRPRPNPSLSNLPKGLHSEQIIAGWPAWLSTAANEAIIGLTSYSSDTSEKLIKNGLYLPKGSVGQEYCNKEYSA